MSAVPLSILGDVTGFLSTDKRMAINVLIHSVNGVGRNGKHSLTKKNFFVAARAVLTAEEMRILLDRASKYMKSRSVKQARVLSDDERIAISSLLSL